MVFPGTPVSPTNKTDCHDITEIALKLMSNTMITNSALGSESINPKIQLSERSFCERLFYQPLGCFLLVKTAGILGILPLLQR
jgi:hypothetical protein